MQELEKQIAAKRDLQLAQQREKQARVIRAQEAAKLDKEKQLREKTRELQERTDQIRKMLNTPEVSKHERIQSLAHLSGRAEPDEHTDRSQPKD